MINTLDDGYSGGDDLNREVMLVSSVSLFLVILLVLSFYLYMTRCVLLTLTPHQYSRHAPSTLTLTLHLRRTESPPPTTGLDPALVAALPVFIVELDAAADGVGHVKTECAVCLSALEHQEMAKLLPNCNHSFHAGCIDTWLASNSTCPLCRASVKPRLESHLREGPTALPLHAAPPSVLEPSQGTTSESDGGVAVVGDGSDSRLSSSKRIFQPSSHDGVDDKDLERQ